jgi:hypothetical protein
MSSTGSPQGAPCAVSIPLRRLPNEPAVTRKGGQGGLDLSFPAAYTDRLVFEVPKPFAGRILRIAEEYE